MMALCPHIRGLLIGSVQIIYIYRKICIEAIKDLIPLNDFVINQSAGSSSAVLYFVRLKLHVELEMLVELEMAFDKQ